MNNDISASGPVFPDKIPAKVPDALLYCIRSFREHPATVGETYGRHWWFTVTIGLRLMGTGIAILIHGILPFLFCRTATNQIAKIYSAFQERSKKFPGAGQE